MSITFDVPNKTHPEQTDNKASFYSQVHSILHADSFYVRPDQSLQSKRQTSPASLRSIDNHLSLLLPPLDLQAPAAKKVESNNERSDTKSTEQVLEIAVKGKNGHQDTVSGIQPRPGETLPQLIKRLHPNLSDEQLAHEVRQVLKYNRDYGNDLGEATQLNPTRSVYLTSVKYLDACGRIARIEGPTGTLTEFNYNTDGTLSSYKMTGSDGSTLEEARKSGSEWLVTKDGKSEQVEAIQVDGWGNIIITKQNGDQFAHLTSGTDVATKFRDNQPVSAEATRQGKPIASYEYQYEGDNVKIFGTFLDDPNKRILLSEQLSPDALERLAAAQGRLQKPVFRQQHANFGIDLPTDSFIAQNIIRSAEVLVGQSVTRFDPSVPTNVGCARMASEALCEAGFDRGLIDANVDSFENKLKARNFVMVSESQLKVGDVIIAKGPGPDAGHTAIYAGDGKILGNSTRKGYFVLGDYQATFGGFESRVGYRYAPSKAMASNR